MRALSGSRSLLDADAANGDGGGEGGGREGEGGRSRPTTRCAESEQHEEGGGYAICLADLFNVASIA